MIPKLEIQSLKIAFNQNEALRELSISVEPRVFTSLVGESGSGKTITALSITRLIKPRHLSGKIYFNLQNGKKINLLDLSEEELMKIRGKEIAYIFQDPGSSLNPVLRVGEQLIEIPGATREKAVRILSEVRLKDPERVYGSYPHELSGGMKQRVMIAMALLSGASLLIADEPTTALDFKTQNEIMMLLEELKRTGNLTILFITHDLGLALSHSDQIYVLQKGHLVEKLIKQDQFASKEPYTKKLFKAMLGEEKPKTYLEVDA